MDKQPKLIDADKLLKTLDDISKRAKSIEMQELAKALATELINGTFDPDPPTIKPGDKVYHPRFKSKGTVKRLSQSGKRAYVIWNYGYMPSYVELKSLEVVESD